MESLITRGRLVLAAGLSLLAVSGGLVVASPFSRASDDVPSEALQAKVQKLVADNSVADAEAQRIRVVEATRDAAATALGLGEAPAESVADDSVFVFVADGRFKPKDFSVPQGQEVPDFVQLAVIFDADTDDLVALTLRTPERVLSDDDLSSFGRRLEVTSE